MRSVRRGRAVLVNGTLAVLLAGGIGFAYVSLGDDEATASATTRTTQVMRGDLTASVSASGAVESATKRSLAFSGSGTVTKIHVAVGATVKKGQKLAELDRTEAQEELDAAEAQFVVAADGDTSTAQGNASYVQAKNAVSAAQRALDGTVLYAPIGGTVTAVNGSVGESASGSSGSSAPSASADSSSGGFIELADPGAVQVTGKFTETDATSLKVGQAATVTFAALPGVTAQGEVAAIDSVPTTESNVVSFGVTISLKDKPEQVRIGQTSSATVTVSEVKDALYVPSAAVASAGGQSTVTVVENGKPVVKRVTVGIAGSSGTEIKSGLQQGEQVQITVATGTGGSDAQPSRGGLGGGGLGGAGGGGGGRAPGGGGGR